MARWRRTANPVGRWGGGGAAERSPRKRPCSSLRTAVRSTAAPVPSRPMDEDMKKEFIQIKRDRYWMLLVITLEKDHEAADSTDSTLPHVYPPTRRTLLAGEDDRADSPAAPPGVADAHCERGLVVNADSIANRRGSALARTPPAHPPCFSNHSRQHASITAGIARGLPRASRSARHLTGSRRVLRRAGRSRGTPGHGPSRRRSRPPH